jgi:hypothetical protein
VKSEKVANPRKDGSLYEDKPQVQVRETLKYRAKGSEAFGRSEPASKYMRGGTVKAVLSPGLGDPWRGRKPGEDRLRCSG